MVESWFVATIVAMSIDLRLLEKLRCRLLERGSDKPVPGIVVQLSIPLGDQPGRGVPVATLVSDATGYLSFDLRPLIARGLTAVPGLRLTAAEVGLADYDVLGSLSGGAENPENRGWLDAANGGGEPPAPLALEFPVAVSRPAGSAATCRPARLASVQRPDRYDYELSPYSFVAPTTITTGDDCCESLVPSTLPVQEHRFYRLVVHGPSLDGQVPERWLKASVNVTDKLPEGSPEILFAEILDYSQRWYHIGHALGQISYSLPLAPGESTELAVVEWSRSDQESRFDSVTGKEKLHHYEHRDRTIEESIDAGLKETQSGWSWMGGLSSGMSYDAKLYGQYTGNWAAGGGASNTSGTRDVDGYSLQDLHDTIVQGTSYTRSLNSTVLIQATQEETSSLSTRRIANHNHCHALTIEYYEVLRHLRIRTESAGHRYAILIPFAPFTFSRERALRFRTVLELALLDSSVAAFFDALVRLELDVYGSTDPEPSPYFTGALAGQVADAGNFPSYPLDGPSQILIERGSTVHLSAKANGGSIAFGGGRNYDVDGEPGTPAPDDHRWPMPGAQGFALLAKIGPDFYEVGFDAAITAKNEGVLSLWFNDKPPLTDNDGTAQVDITVTAPSGDPAPDTGRVPDTVTDPKTADQLREKFLLEHLNGNAGYYDRVVWTLMDPAERRLYLEATLGRGNPLLTAIDDKPLGVSGSHVAFEYDGPAPFVPSKASAAPLESIVTLPTRGLFAEAQLGHCNSCEPRDVTRMWDWREMTVEEPPPITGITPGPQGQPPTITPTALPGNVIQIAQPPAEPDPAGLAAALRVLGTPNVFRDMSGLAEASDLLGRLADGTNRTLAEMTALAGQAKQKVDQARTQGGAASSGTTYASAQTPAQRYDNLQVAKQLAASADELGLDKSQVADLTGQIVGGGVGYPLGSMWTSTVLGALADAGTGAGLIYWPDPAQRRTVAIDPANRWGGYFSFAFIPAGDGATGIIEGLRAAYSSKGKYTVVRNALGHFEMQVSIGDDPQQVNAIDGTLRIELRRATFVGTWNKGKPDEQSTPVGGESADVTGLGAPSSPFYVKFTKAELQWPS